MDCTRADGSSAPLSLDGAVAAGRPRARDRRWESTRNRRPRCESPGRPGLLAAVPLSRPATRHHVGALGGRLRRSVPHREPAGSRHRHRALDPAVLRDAFVQREPTVERPAVHGHARGAVRDRATRFEPLPARPLLPVHPHRRRSPLAGPSGPRDATSRGRSVFGGNGLALRGARPNPARHGWFVEFSLPDDGPAELSVYDLTGRLLQTREVGGQGRGRHVIDMGATSGLEPGVYLLRLRQGSHSVSAKAIVLRP